MMCWCAAGDRRRGKSGVRLGEVAVVGCLPVWPVVRRSYLHLWDRRRDFRLPLMIVFGVQLLLLLPIDTISSPAAGLPAAWVFGLRLISVVVWSAVSFSFVVAIHRQVLLGEAPVCWKVFRPRTRLLRYIGGWLFLSVLPGMIVLAFLIWSAILAHFSFAGPRGRTFIEPEGRPLIEGAWAIAIAFATWFFLRSMLLLPAAAVGAKQGWATSWDATKGNVLRLLALLLLVVMPAASLEPALWSLIKFLSEGSIAVTKAMVIPVSVFACATDAIVLVLFPIALSLSYDVLVRGGTPAAR
jgi:hypothetical protein